MRWLGICAAITLSLAGVARAEILVTVSKADQELSVAINGVPTYRWQVSTGKPGRETPVGSYKAIRLERVYYSQKFDSSPMPNSVFFHGGYAIHGTNEADKLGKPVSHGCVRLSRANAETLMHLVKAHGMAATRIVVKDGALGGAMAASEKLPVVKVADREVRPRDDRDPPQRESRTEPRYDPRLAPYSERRDPRDEARGPYSAPRDPRDEPQNFSRPRLDPRDEPRDRLREPPRDRRDAMRAPERRRDYRDDPRDRRQIDRRADRYDPRLERRAPLRYRDDPRDARRFSPAPRNRVELLREYERLARRQNEIERELMRSRDRGLLRDREPPRERYREPPRDRYSGPPPRERDMRNPDPRDRRDLRERDEPPARDLERRPPREPARYRERYSDARG
ncbi:MAG: L,D-transpeptidase family protein [Pseudolabrys sp.]|nr:L,D-transpeptidase family protein [Pseudolabrys sp.]